MNAHQPVSALIVAAGKGVRTGNDLPKQYCPIAGKAVLAHAIDAFLAHPGVGEVQVVIGEGQEALYRDAIGDRTILPPVAGGATRRESVLAGLAQVTGGIVLIHDAARPFLPASVIDALIEALATYEGALPVLPVADTLAKADGLLGETVDRAGMVRVQTPQAFHLDKIRAAHAAWPADRDATDDTQVARAFGIEVATVPGEASLDKLTYRQDFDAAERRIRAEMTTRVGMGFDVHAFAEGDHVWLGGIAVPHDRKLAGHSDADVALHALTDAILGAIGEGDIGDHFPPSDPQWKGAPSRLFLEHAAKLVRDKGGVIDHVDVTIICEAPKVGPHRAAIRESIAAMLGLTIDRISIKATTTERLGFTGRKEGIAAQAVATIRLKESA
jgi:2-C-methyl-D-erythritol 4-phosphate cytidylyltransferase/2-C-methyl-D-erythritol 2,4-cyclodiphosphate synthase